MSIPATLDSVSDEPFRDAYVFGQLDPDLLNRTITIASAGTAKAKVWTNSTATLRSILEKLCTFQRGEKDGWCFLQGCVATSGSQRLIENMSTADLLVFDVDNGLTVDHALTLLEGYFAVVWTTHSHNKTETFASDSELTRFLKRDIPAPTPADVVRYFVETKKARPELFVEAQLSAHDPALKGYTLKHQPWPKLRVLLVLAAPFNFKERGAAEWKARYHGAADFLRLVVDASCSDPSRLFYTPRIPHGAVIGEGHADIAIVPGTAFDLDAVPIERKPAKAEKGAAQALPPNAFDRAKCFKAIADISAEDRQTWLKVGQVLHYESDGSEEGFELWSAWSKNAEHKYDAADQQRVWNSFRSDHPNPIKIGTLIEMARGPKPDPLAVFNGPSTSLVPVAQTRSPVGALLADLARSFARDLGAEFERGKQAVAQQARAPQITQAPIEVKRVSEQLEQPELPWSVDELMLGGAWGFLVADTGFGKTFILVHLALCLETGRPFFGRKIRQRGGTIAIVGEGAYSTRNRFEAARRFGFPDLKESAARYIDTPPDLAHPKGINEKVLAELIERLRQTSAEMQQRDGLPLKLVQFDTFAKCFPNLQEDKAAEAIHAHNVMERIAKALDVAVICASHVGKDASKGMRGSSSHKQNCHFMLTIPKQGGLFLEKVKDAPQGIGLGRFELPSVKLGEKKDGTPITSCYVREGTLGHFSQVPAPGDEAQDDSDSQKLLRVALLAASDGIVENPASPGSPAAKWESVADKFTGLYLDGKEADDKMLAAKRGAWARATKNPPADIVADKENGIVYAISQA